MNAYEAADFIEECQLEDAVGELSPDQIAYLDEILPDWRDVDAEAMRTEVWLEELNIGYSSSVESATTWLGTQQRLARSGALPAAQRVRLDAALPGWLMA
ncbi:MULTISPECIES: hypothetical protein [unclassified Microbacterium]|uniref:hypothetical protein n=1 Tax=unclassified Microbacterium TaxID=2609290 RepID=UPI00109D203B|nr:MULTISPECIES: hypothetical protein [unclassified Microbacterium]